MPVLRILVNLFKKCLLNEFVLLSKIEFIDLFIEVFIEHPLCTKQYAKFSSYVGKRN